MQEYYRTIGVCPKCLGDAAAQVVEKDGAAVMVKDCPEHGVSEATLCKYGEDWAWLRRYHDIMHPHDRPPKERHVLLAPTVRCNLNCDFCFMFAGDRPFHEPSIEELAEYFKNHRHERIIVFGGEPTVRKDLPEILRLIVESGNVPVVQTNGIMLAEMDYASRLKEAGLAEVFLTFDGFEEATAQTLRGRPVNQIRQQAIRNLAELNVPIFFSASVGKGLNDHELAKTIDFAIENPIIRGVYFRACVPLGRHSPSEHFMRVDEILDRLDDQTGGRIGFQEVISFLGLFTGLQPLLNMQRCWTEFYYVIFRRPGGGYDTIGDVIDFERLAPHLDRYAKLRERGLVRIAEGYLLTHLTRCIRWNRIGTVADIARSFLKVLFNRRFGLGASNVDVTSRTLLLGFNEFCSINNYDQKKFVNCPAVTYDEQGQMVSFCSNNLKRQRLWQKAMDRSGAKAAKRSRLG